MEGSPGRGGRLGRMHRRPGEGRAEGASCNLKAFLLQMGTEIVLNNHNGEYGTDDTIQIHKNPLRVIVSI